ncbi:Nmad3 family putative nucleotide modification protein [Pseudomonas sp. LB3P81]
MLGKRAEAVEHLGQFSVGRTAFTGSVFGQRQHTAPCAKNPTQWRLPSWLFPGEGIYMLSFHPDLNRWTHDGEFCLLKSAARGQEFVFDSRESQEPIAWIKGLLEVAGH